MSLASPLPNDLLRNPPWPETIISWPINEEFLAFINASEEELREQGYYLKYGIEVNLEILSPAEAKRLRDRRQSPILSAWRQASREQFLEDLAEASSSSATFLSATKEAHKQLSEIAIQRQKLSDPESQEWLRNWELTQSFYREALNPNEPAKTILARKNLVIAALHLLPQHLGGLHGLIEQRFASEHYGYGWWDGRNIVELRTLPAQGHENAIANYHQVLWRLRNAIKQFGLVPVAHHAIGQVHHSLWRISDDKNLMAGDDEESLSLRAYAAFGIYELMDDYPINQFSPRLNPHPVDTAPFIGSSRVSAVRTCGDNWELRLYQNSGVTHLAHDIFLITKGISSGIKFKDAEDAEEQGIEVTPPKIENFTYIEEGMGLINKVLQIPVVDRGVEIVKRLSIAANPPRVACPFVSCLENAVLDDENEFSVPLDVIQWNLYMLHKAIGQHGANLFSAQIDGVTHNLGTALGWQELFQKIRIADDQTIDTSAIHPLLAKPFRGLTVTSIRQDIHMRENSDQNLGFLQTYWNMIKANLLAEGKMVWSDNLKGPLRQIFGFVRKQNIQFDPEETVPHLVQLYNEMCKWPGASKSMAKSVDRAISKTMYSAMGNLLVYAMYYRELRPVPKGMPYFEDHDILRSMLSYRKNLPSGLSEAARFDPPRSAQFFERLAPYFHDPVKLYAFENVTDFFMQIADMGILMFAAYTKGNDIHFTSKQDLVRNQPELGELHDSLLSVCASAVRLAAAIQCDEIKTTDILRQYSKQASTLTRRFVAEPVPAGNLNLVIHQMKVDFLDDIECSIAEEARRLMSDERIISALQQKAADGPIL